MTQVRIEVTPKSSPPEAPWQFQDHLPIKIGSLAANKLQLRGPTVSRMHAVIEQPDAGGPIVIVDLSSETGTKVGDRVIGREVIQKGSVITIGDYMLHIAGIGDDKVAPSSSGVMPIVQQGVTLTSEAPQNTATVVVPPEPPSPEPTTMMQTPSEEVLGLQHDLTASRADLEMAQRAVKRSRGVARFFQWCATNNWPAPSWADAEKIAQLVDDMTAKLNLQGFTEDDVFVVAASLTQFRTEQAQRQRRRPNVQFVELGSGSPAESLAMLKLLFGF